MKIKKKLLLGFGLLFIVVLILGAVSIYYIEIISKTSSITVKNNYQTLTFTREMRSTLDENNLPLTIQAADEFNRSLKKQEHNITEHGEKDATAGVRQLFSSLIDPASNLNQKLDAQRRIRFLLNTIDGLNMNAIVNKNEYTRSTVNKATFYLGGIGFITFLIIFVLIANFPSFILNPLDALTDGLQEVTNNNFDTRLDFKTSEEFTQLSNAFNAMTQKIGEADNTNLTKIISGESRIKILIEAIHDAVIGVDEKDEVLFMNSSASTLIYPGKKDGIDKNPHKSKALLNKILSYKSSETPLKIEAGETILYFDVQSFDIVAPNLKLNTADVVQYAGYPAGRILILSSTRAHAKNKA